MTAVFLRLAASLLRTQPRVDLGARAGTSIFHAARWTCTRCTLRVTIWAGALLVWPMLIASTTVARDAAESQPEDAGPPLAMVERFQIDVRPFLADYCASCHAGGDAPAGIHLDAIDQVILVQDDRERWERVVRMVRDEMMPPHDEAQPSTESRSAFVEWFDSELARTACLGPRRMGAVTIRRLNRAEYNNTVRDLLGVVARPADDFPGDDVSQGFDNLADALSLPPLLMEKYLDAAQALVDQVFAQGPLRDRIVTLQPDADRSANQCAREVLARFATRAFRRPVTDDELEGLMQLVREATEHGQSYPESLKWAMQAVLVSPHFLFRIELDDGRSAPDSARPLTDYELASRLSYFLWSSMPDDTLLELAKEGRLSEEEVLHREMQRMLADPKAQALVENFAAQWLSLRELARMTPDPERFPDFDDDLRRAMRLETEHFFTAILRNDRSTLDFIDCDYTYLNERLARHYGIEGVVGDEFREVKLSDRRRGGLLAHGSILTLTSNPTRTSPVKRGKWILERILGTPPPPPPPNVEELKDDEQAELLGSLRERMEQHRADPNCAVCHRKMDTLGFGLENFDAVGKWRDRDGRFAIDASGLLPGNRSFAGPAELRTLLKRHDRRAFVRCLTEKMLTYALGRAVQSWDRCAVDTIVQHVEENEYRFRSLVWGIIQSEPFRRRDVEPNEGKHASISQARPPTGPVPVGT